MKIFPVRRFVVRTSNGVLLWVVLLLIEEAEHVCYDMLLMTQIIFYHSSSISLVLTTKLNLSL